MAQIFCDHFDRRALGELNGNYLDQSASIEFRTYDPAVETCGPVQSADMRVFLPLLFKYEVSCTALIPMSSSIGTPNGYVSVEAYAAYKVGTRENVNEMTFVYRAPYDDCTLRLISIRMIDLRCQLDTITTPTTGSGGPISTTISTISGSTSIGTITTTTGYYTSHGGLIWDKYTRIGSIPAGFGPPEDGAAGEECRIRVGQFVMLMRRTLGKDAELACLMKGYKGARIMRDTLPEAVRLLGECTRPGSSAWIQEYWKPLKEPGNLQLVAGSKPGTGGISLEPATSRKRQPVICIDPYFQK